MAWSEVTVDVVGNPATPAGRKGRKVKVKRKLTDKQIKHFGTARQKAALKARRSALRSKPAAKAAAKKKSSHRPRTVKNPGPELLALTLGNPATSRRASTTKGAKKTMAVSKTKSSQKRNSGGGGGKSRKKQQFRKPLKRNPAGLGSPMDWLTGGAGVLGGIVGTRAVPQLVLGDKNVGPMGYFANALTAAGLGWLTYIVFPRNRILIGGVVAGGFAGLIARVIGDNTTYGKYLTLTGVGDYMVSNAVSPQRLVNPDSAMVEVPNGWGSAPMAMLAAGSDMSAGVDLGRRAGVC